MSECLSYDMKWWHYLIPSINEYKKLCDSYDKTYMFLVVLIRFIFYTLLFKFLIDQKIVIFDEDKNVQYFLFIVFLTINVISLINLIIVSLKEQKNQQRQDKIIIDKPTEPKKPIIPINIFDNELSATNEERIISGY